jgi:hypothetical protein
MKEVQLTKGYVAIVDDEDYERVNQFGWHCDNRNRVFYARRNFSSARKQIFMHRFIMGTPREMAIDHINHNGLDNRKTNLRVCTHSQNSMNQRKCRGNKTSAFKGVYFNRNYKKWYARIKMNHKQIHIGAFEIETDAAIAYDDKAKELFGKFAVLNFPERIENHAD